METEINDIRVIMKETYTRLVSFKSENNKESFNKEFLKILPKIYRYVAKRLNSAVSNGKIE